MVKAKLTKAAEAKAKIQKATVSKVTKSKAEASKANLSKYTVSKTKIPKETHFEAWNEDRTLVEPVIAKPPVKITEYRLHVGDRWVTTELAQTTPEPAVKKTAALSSKKSKEAESEKSKKAKEPICSKKGKGKKQDESEDEAEAEPDLVDLGWKRFTIPPTSAREVMYVQDPDATCFQCKRAGDVKTKCGEPCYQAFRKQLLGERVIEIKQGAFGYGAYTRPDAKTIRKYRYIDEYIGELRPATVSQGSRYFCAIDGICQVDAGEYGNWTRFINSSCDPNLEAKTGYAGKRKFVVFRAIKDVKPGSELTFHYGSDYFGPFGIRCSCGAEPDPHSPFEMAKPKPGRKRKGDAVAGAVDLSVDAAEAEEEGAKSWKKAAKGKQTKSAIKTAPSTKKRGGLKNGQLEEGKTAVEPPKKRRRPSKKDASGGEAAVGIDSLKRKRGRPKKVEQDDVPHDDDDVERPNKRGRTSRN
ncbi:SET domain-containing protein [Teratosphaeria nubilosa]|uniref:SET domain-containing protein n=1 Tax=Teratosphaeria nubilosa TaxID=161662 RepID=A0A6G1LEH2_9PEZI|nr:SET domain-containing protein [Teratosphaeria nubilosa]